MKKQIIKKIISTTTIFIFVIFFLQILSPIVTSAANELNWENPNKNGKNPYKFSLNLKNVLNSGLMMQVVGCTGAVNKISGAIAELVQSKAKDVANELKNEIMAEKIKELCAKGKGAELAGVSIFPNLTVTEASNYIINCKDTTFTKDVWTLKKLEKMSIDKANSDRIEQCFNGIAIQLARNQLTAMTRYTVNWVNSGFNGDPMYVRNITSLTNSMERNVLETGINILSNKTRKAFPYGSDFSRSIINNYRTGGIKYGATNLLDSLASDLGNFVTDPRSYYSEENLKETPFERSTRVNNAFSNDFSVGGWKLWLGLTQREQNNPLGFTMLASQYLADQEQQKIEETKQELLTNQGFLSQKRCTKWQVFTEENVQKMNGDKFVFSKNKTSNFDKCWSYETVTPGSVIKDKVSTYLNSPERQLELADTINESLNTLFTSLISKFQNQGLSSLSSENYTFSNPNMGTGYGSNNLDSGDIFGESTSSGYTNGSFDLTRDLGNKYIHDYDINESNLGDWDASINTITKNNFKSTMERLNIGIPPTKLKTIEGQEDQVIPLTNVYYVVKKAGTTKLFENGYNGWAIGDRAFWNGSEWQNWKKGTANPIKERGVVQIQKDYIVAANELLKKLPSIMPKIGELDYCIPGPNPSWETNYAETESKLFDFSNSVKAIPSSSSKWWGTTEKMTFSSARSGDSVYDDYKKMFDGTSLSWWDSVLHTSMIGNISILGDMGDTTKIEDTNWAMTRIDMFNEDISNASENFPKIFKENMASMYGDRMLKPFKEKENTSEQIPNPEYIPMAEEGLNITKNIISYNEDISTATEDYKKSISELSLNIYKLDQIRSAVNKIIVNAQGRRDARLLEILKSETRENCKKERTACLARTDIPIDDIEEICGTQFGQCNQKTMTEAEYKTKYASCLEEEDILYMEDFDITNYENEEGRCNDSLDNDRDGYVDSKDPDCSGHGGNGGGPRAAYCDNGTYVTQRPLPRGMTSTSCMAQDTILKNNNIPESTRKRTCESYNYYTQNEGIDESSDPYLVYDCKWNSETN